MHFSYLTYYLFLLLLQDFKEIILQDSTFTSRENETIQKANTLPINELISFQQTIDKSP